MQPGQIFVHNNVGPQQGLFRTLRVREDVLYTDAYGRPKSGIRKTAEKILTELEWVLSRVLAREETILYAARMNTAVSVVEQLTASWMVYRTVVVAMVFTDQRILCFPIEYEGRWKRSLRMVPYEGLQSTKVGGWFSKTFDLRYGGGEKDRFSSLKWRDASKIEVLLRALLASNAGAGSWKRMLSLCPECLHGLQPEIYQCGGCGLVFKDEKTMRKRTWTIPSGGYFYCDAVGMGALALMAQLYILLEVLLFVLALAGALLAPQHDWVGILTMAGTLAIFLGFFALEKLIQIVHCRRLIREFIPTGQRQPLGTMGAAAGPPPR